jgi:hypothetical protein
MNALEHILTLTEAKPTGQDKYIGHCPAHGSKRHRDLSIKLTSERILLHCFAACDTQNICRSLGIELKDLFRDVLDPNPRKRKAAAQARERERYALQQGTLIDALREADAFIQSRRGIDISTWIHERLNDELNSLADACLMLESEALHG